MTGDPSSEPRDVATDARPGRPSREDRATVAFLATGLFLLLVVLLYRGTISSIPVVGAMTLVGPVIAATVELLLAVGLAAGARWARAAMTPVLWIVGLSGVITFLVSLTRGGIDIPIGALVAIWALQAPPRRGLGEAPGQRAGSVAATILVTGMAIVAAWPLIAPTATQAGGPLIAAAADLYLDLQPASPCPSGPGADHTPPDTIDVVLRWTWARGEPVRAGTDAVVLSWATMSDGEGAGYYLDEPIAQQPGVTEEDRSWLHAVYRIDLATRGFEPGTVSIRLRRPNELAAGPGLVEVAANYAHHYAGLNGQQPLGVWTRATVMTCDW